MGPEAEGEITEAADWYDEQGPELRSRFLDAVDQALDLIRSNPHQYQVVFRALRRMTLGDFPYSMIYMVVGHEVTVVACIHTSRDPRRWQRRLLPNQ